MTRQNTPREITTWQRIGNANPWIRAAHDPPFDASRITRVGTLAELEKVLAHRNWEIGHGVAYQGLRFIQQVIGGDEARISNAGDEWLVIRGGEAVDSVTFHGIIAGGDFAQVVGRLAVGR